MIFDWRGSVPASKSILNRLAILGSFEPGLIVDGDSDCEDVALMRGALAGFAQGAREFNCGAAGTVLRFLVPRLAREPGVWSVRGEPRLFARAPQGLTRAMQQIGVKIDVSEGGVTVTSRGWRAPKTPVLVDRTTSSQFASGLLLSAVNLPFDLELRWSAGAVVSDGYWEMSLELVRAHGLEVDTSRAGAFIAHGQTLRPGRTVAEPDASSAFALAAAGALAGRTRLERFPFCGLQPDASFPAILRRMGVRIDHEGHDLIVSNPPEGVCGINVNLLNSPDLFPVLAVVCAFAKGRSKLSGAPHLAHKESSRIESTSRLLTSLGARARSMDDGLEIDGRTKTTAVEFDPESDHRLAMAAAVGNLALSMRGESQLRILNPTTVDKSFPGFWRAIEAGLAKAAQ